MSHLTAHLLDGQPTSQIFLDNRAMLYGDGLFETILCIGGKLLLWDLHMARLAAATRRLHLAWNESLCDHLQEQANRLIGSQLDPLVIKLLLFRTGNHRGYTPGKQAGLHTQVSIYPLEQKVFQPKKTGYSLWLAQTRLGRNPAIAGLKHLNRLEQVLASQENENSQFDEGLMMDTGGAIIEGVRSNVFFGARGSLVTPDLTECGVSGVMREYLLQLTKTLGIEVNIAKLHLKDLHQFSECFLCNSLIGVQGVTSLDLHGHSQMTWGIGKSTQKLQQMLSSQLFNSTQYG